MTTSSFDLDATQHVVISPNAIKKAKELIDQSNNQKMKLRIFIVGGGCRGLQYGFQLDEYIDSDDVVIERDGVSFVMDPISFCYISQATIDYQDEPKEMARFVVNNPHVCTSCRCHHEAESTEF